MAGLCHDLAATAGAVHRCEKELILQGLQGKIQEASWIQLVQKKHQSPSTSLDSPCLVCFFLAQHKFALSHQSASPLLRDVERVFTKQTWTLSVGITHKYDDDYDGIPDVTTIRKTIVFQSSIATSNTKMMSRRLDASGKDDPQLREHATISVHSDLSIRLCDVFKHKHPQTGMHMYANIRFKLKQTKAYTSQRRKVSALPSF